MLVVFFTQNNSKKREERNENKHKGSHIYTQIDMLYAYLCFFFNIGHYFVVGTILKSVTYIPCICNSEIALGLKVTT